MRSDFTLSAPGRYLPHATGKILNLPSRNCRLRGRGKVSTSKGRVMGYGEDIQGGLGNKGHGFAGGSFDLHLGGGPVGEEGHSRQSRLLGRAGRQQ